MQTGSSSSSSKPCISQFVAPSGLCAISLLSIKDSLRILNSIVPLFAATGKIKKGFNSTDSNTYSFGTTTLSPNNEENCVFLSLTNTVTNSMKAGRYVYDVEISATDSDGNVTVERILEGKLTVSPSVTK